MKAYISKEAQDFINSVAYEMHCERQVKKLCNRSKQKKIKELVAQGLDKEVAKVMVTVMQDYGV